MDASLEHVDLGGVPGSDSRQILANPPSLNHQSSEQPSYKLWHAFLRDCLLSVAPLPVSHPRYQSLNKSFERALGQLNKMPRIWLMYLDSLSSQNLLTTTRRTFNRALCALPVMQHDRIWKPYLDFVSRRGVPVETALRVHRRYLLFNPSHVEDFVVFLMESQLWQEAAERLASVLNDDQFYSTKGKSKHQLWLQFCDLVSQHATDLSGDLKVDQIIRGGIRVGKFACGVGRLWTALADYYIRRGHFEKARYVFEEGITTVMMVGDFSLIFDSYSSFEETALCAKMETLADQSDDEEEDEGGDGEDRRDVSLAVGKLARKVHALWLDNDNDVDIRLARLSYLIRRRPELVNSVLLRRNPHNVEWWHARVKLFEDNPTKQIFTYAEAVRAVDHEKAIGNPHTLWIAFAKLYEKHSDLVNARVVFGMAVQENYKTVEDLASVWSEWAEMECRHKSFMAALNLIRRATAEPSLEVKRRGKNISMSVSANIFC